MIQKRNNSRLFLLLVLLGFSLPVLQPLHGASFLTNAPMNFNRRAHTATLLLDGKVLVVGGDSGPSGYVGSAELYDSAAGTWLPTGSMTNITGYGTNSPTNMRAFHTATLLANGKVLVAGGIGADYLTSAQLYDPVIGTWAETGFMNTARFQHTATLLSDGRVLIAGGKDGFGNSIASAEVYDPATGSWMEIGPMNSIRWQHTATLLPNGKVLIAAGGALINGISGVSFNLLTSTELFDPAAGTWTPSGNLHGGRLEHDAVLLASGKVLVVGGFDGVDSIQSTELYDPASGVWSPSGAMTTLRDTPQATLLPDHKVLVSGGYDSRNLGSRYLSTAELYDPALGSWTTNGVGGMNDRRWQHTATLLTDGRVLLAGGYDGSRVIKSTEIYGSVSAATNGSLKVTISPAGAISGGAQWQVDGGPFRNSGAVVTNLSGGTHVVSFTSLPGFVKPADQLTTIVSRTGTNLVTGVYIPNPGAVQVTLSPAGAVTDGAQWQVDGGTFLSSGATVTNLSVGSHTIAFKTIGGWFAPGSQVVTIVSDTTTNLTGTYSQTQTAGGLQVNLSPAGAVAAGARWQVDGGALQTSGAVVGGLAPGNHLLTFSPVVGFITPASQTAAVGSNATNSFSGVYAAAELIKPTLILGAPLSGKRYSNSVFTATGTAKDNVRVAAVFYQLNTNDWATAVLAGNFTNWTAANLLLTPGTNTFKVYAVDTSNNRSTTNTVKFVYVLTDRLLVQLNGRGTLSPNYRSALLEIGRNYAMTATAASGFRFVGWTGNFATSAAKLAFNMQSNLSLTANFLDISRPVNIVLTPTANKRLSNEVFAATGKARDNLRVSNVWCQLNTNAWTLAATANNWTNWTAPNLVLTPGTNFIRAYAEDTTGNRSLTNTIKFIYVLTDLLGVQFNGKGTLTPNYSNALLEIGKNYSMTATAAAGFRFVNWTGTFTTNTAKLTFNMQSNLSFTANFLDTARPVNFIAAPVANQKWSNLVFTASGKATDNVGIANAWYQLNGAGWNPAVLAPNRTNWSTPGLTNFLLSGSNQLQAFAADAVGNVSLTNTVNFTYRVQPVGDWAPDSLNGLLATITQPDSGDTNVQSVGFDLTTFAQTGADTNDDNFGVGQYLYTKTGTNTAYIGLTYNAPPTLVGQDGEASFVFTNHYSGYFTNEHGDLAGIRLVIATNFLPGFVAGKSLIATDTGSGNVTTLKFSNRTSFTQSGGGGPGAGSYTLTRFSPVCGMLTLTYTNAPNLGRVAYVQTTYTNAANGIFHANSFDSLGNLQNTDSGRFKMQ